MWEKIRKFGLDHHDLPTMLGNIAMMLKMLALDVDSRDKKPVSILTYIFMAVICSCYYYVYFVSVVWFVFVRSRDTGNLLEAIIVLSLGTASQISMIKLLCLMAHRKSLRMLVDNLLAFDAQVKHNVRFADHKKKSLKLVKKRAMTLWSVIMWNGIVYFTKALCMSERHHMEEAFVFYGFENMEKMKTSPYYEIAFTINVFGVMTTCYPVAVVSSLFVLMAGYIEAQMLALSQELCNIWEDALKHCGNTSIYESLNELGDSTFTATSKSRRKKTGDDVEVAKNNNTCIRINYECRARINRKLNKYVRERLVAISTSHSININLVHQIEVIFQTAIALEFMILCASLITCLLGGLENTYIQLPFILMLVSMDCVTGQRIINACTSFEKAVYESKWENFDVANRRMILMMLRNSQKVMEFSVGGITILSLESLMLVLKATYTAYTTLRSIMRHSH